MFLTYDLLNRDLGAGRLDYVGTNDGQLVGLIQQDVKNCSH